MLEVHVTNSRKHTALRLTGRCVSLVLAGDWPDFGVVTVLVFFTVHPACDAFTCVGVVGLLVGFVIVVASGFCGVVLAWASKQEPKGKKEEKKIMKQ